MPMMIDTALKTNRETGAATPLADPLSRWVAKFIDILLAIALSRLLPPIGFFAGLTYLLVGDGITPGHSLGKRALGLVVYGSQGRPCTVRESILRNIVIGAPYIAWYLLTQGGWLLTGIGWIALVAACGLEGILLAGSRQGLRIGDELAGTSVTMMHATDHA